MGKVVDVVREHLPSSVASIRNPHFDSRAHVYASLIRSSIVAGADINGFTESTSTPRDVILALRKLSSTLDGLSKIDRRWLLSRSFVNLSENANALDEFQTDVGVFLSGALAMRKHHDRPKASQKRNWKACAAAFICRQVWADEEIASNGVGWQKYCAERLSANEDIEFLKSSFQKDFAPKSQKADSPGSFGRFLEDVLEAHGVWSPNGIEPMSAASALRSLKVSRQHTG